MGKGHQNKEEKENERVSLPAISSFPSCNEWPVSEVH